MVTGTMLIFVSNLLYSVSNLQKRILFLFFNLTFFLFLMGRPFIQGLKGLKWWSDYTDSAVFFSLIAIFSGLFFLQIGAILCDNILERISRRTKEKVITHPPQADSSKASYYYYLQIISLTMFYICMICYLYIEIEKLVFMNGRTYEDYYILYKTDVPFPIGTLATMMPYTLCFFLSTFPSKKQTFVPFVLYFLSAVPVFIIGVRNPIVLNSIFIFLYYYLRDYLDSLTQHCSRNRIKWIGKFEKRLLIILVPVALLGLAAYNYIREGTQISQTSFWDLFVDFVDKQGVSFKTLCLGYNALPDMPQGQRFYTFGGFIEYYFYGSLGQWLFGTPDLGIGNNMVRALQGHTFAHSMSYVAKPDYLEGHGWGSSYLLEAYADFGWTGIVISSVLLGMVLIAFVYFFSQNWLGSSITLVCLTSIFFVPRAETTGWLLFLAQPHFWIAVLFCNIMAGLCLKSYSLQTTHLATVPRYKR